MSPLAFRILAANELLHALDHTSRFSSDDGSLGDVQNGLYWKNQRVIDKNLGMLTLFLPEKLQFSRNPRSLDAILVHMSTNMGVIQIHRTAMALMHQYSMPSYLISQSQARLLPAAENILSIFQTAGDSVGTAIRNPLLSFAAYMAASVFLDDLQAAGAGRNQSQQSEENLRFLIRIFVFFGSTNQLVRTVAFQLASDLKQTGFDSTMMDKVRSYCSRVVKSKHRHNIDVMVVRIIADYFVIFLDHESSWNVGWIYLRDHRTKFKAFTYAFLSSLNLYIRLPSQSVINRWTPASRVAAARL